MKYVLLLQSRQGLWSLSLRLLLAVSKSKLVCLWADTAILILFVFVYFFCVLAFFNDLRRNIFQSSVCMCTSAVHPLCFPPSFHLWAQTWSSVFLWSFPLLCTDKAVSDNIQGYSWVWAWLNDDTVCVPNASHAVVPVLMNRLVFKRNVSLEFSAVALWNLKVVLKGCVAVSLLALVWLVPCYKVSLGRW